MNTKEAVPANEQRLLLARGGELILMRVPAGEFLYSEKKVSIRSVPLDIHTPRNYRCAAWLYSSVSGKECKSWFRPCLSI